MQFSVYENYITVVESDTLTAAAKKLGIAQPALSNQIKALEQLYRTTLFHRVGQRLSLSESGRILYEKAKEMVSLEREAALLIHNSYSGEKGTLRYGHTSSINGDGMTRFMKRFALTYPGVSFKVVEADQNTLLKELISGVIEIAILPTERGIPENFEIIYREPSCMVALWKKDEPRFQDLPQGKIPYDVFTNHPVAISSTTQQSILALKQYIKAWPDLRIIGTRFQDCFSFVKEGFAMTMLPHFAVEELPASELEGLEIREMQKGPLLPCLAVVAQPYRYRSQVAKNFLNMLCATRGWEMSSEQAKKEE